MSLIHMTSRIAAVLVAVATLLGWVACDGRDEARVPHGPVDTTPPRWGDQAVRVFSVTRTTAAIEWAPAIDFDDDARATGTSVHYELRVGTASPKPIRVMGTSYTMTRLIPGTHYEVDVVAVDASGNRSFDGLRATFTTDDGCTVALPIRPREVAR